jgi:hypothetical protein
MAGESIWLSVDFGNLPEENTAVGYLGSGSLNYPSEVPLLAKEEAHIIPKSTAKQKYPLLWIEVELSLFNMSESCDSLVPSEVPEVLFWMHPLYNLGLFTDFFSVGNSEKSSIMF